MNKIIEILVREDVIKLEDKEIYEYGLFVFVFNIICLLSMLVIGYITNNLQFTLMFMLYFIPLRMLVGGYHCKTAKHCYFSFNIVYFIILIIHSLFIYNEIYICFCLIISVAILFNVSGKKAIRVFLLLLVELMILINYKYSFSSFFFSMFLNYILVCLKRYKK